MNAHVEVAADPTVHVRPAVSEADAVAIHKLLMMMGREVALMPVDPLATMRWILDVMANGAALMAMVDDLLVGTLGLLPAHFRYAPEEPFIGEQWLWIAPPHRNGGPVGPALLDYAKGIADEAQRLLIVSIMNVERRRGRPQGRLERAANLLMYQPAGVVLAYTPMRKD